MRKFLTTCGLLCALVVSGFAADLPNYSGTWVLDKDRSKGLPPNMTDSSIEMTVTQDDKQLKIKRSAGDQEVAYNLDGSKAKVEMTGRMPGEATVYLEKKDDGKLVLYTQRELNFQGNAVTIKIIETWELADNGKTLKAKRTTESPRGTQEAELVYTLKS